MKRYFMIILIGIVVIGFAFYQNAKSNSLKKKYVHNIEKAILAGEKYRDEPNDTNRIQYVKALKNLVVMYAEIRDRERNRKNDDKACNAKWLCTFLSSAYDILEIDKNQAEQLDDLLDALHTLRSDPFDETGEALNSVLRFVNANS